MSTFFSTSFKPQPHIRQEGFHLDNEGSGGGLTATGEHHEGSGVTPPPFDFGRSNVMDFTDELASLMGAASPHPGHQSHHGGHDGLSHSHHESHIHGSHHESHLHGLHHHDHHGHHQHNQSHERSTHSPSDDVSGSYRTTHNIFDMGVGNPVAVSPSTTTTTATSHFNSTVPPLNSSMRFEQPSQHDYHHSTHTPSPPLGGKEPSRSRSRPPTGGASGGVGPQRTTRSRRTNSISSTSPPPHIRPAAQAIVIPGVRHTNGSLASPLSSSATSVTNTWGFTSSSPTGTSASEFTLPTPDSLHHHHHSNSLSHSMHNPHLSTSVGFGGYFGSEFGGYGGHGGQHNGGHTPSTSLPVSGTIHSHLGTAGSGAGGGGGGGGHGHGHGHHRTSSAAASTTAGSASGPGGSAASAAGTMTTQEKQAMAASEKRRRRRESHNAVERRRRDNINEKISELATLIPESLLEGGSLPPANGGPQNILPAPGSNGGDSPTGTDLLSPTSPTADSDLWSAPLITMKKEDGLDGGLGGLESPILPSGGIGGANTTTTGNGSGGNGNGNGGAGGVVKANKGMILRKSVEYIRYLQQVVQEQGNRNRQLEMELRGYKERNGESISPTIPAPAFDFQTNGVSGSGSNGSSGAYHGAGYGGSFRMLDSMPEDEAEPNTCGQKPVTTTTTMNRSRESTPLTEDEEPVDDDDPNDPDVQPPASLRKGSGAGSIKRATRGRKAATTATGTGPSTGKTRTKSKKADEEDVDMVGGSDEEGAGAMEV